jgi:dihydroflavonol-4-reductase
VAAGHLLAMDRGRVGERYVLGGEDVTLAAMLGEIAALTGRKAPTKRLPRGPLYPLAHLFEAAAKLTGKEPMLTVDALNMSRHVMYFSSAKAVRELGYSFRPHREALADALAWFRQEGYLGAP